MCWECVTRRWRTRGLEKERENKDSQPMCSSCYMYVRMVHLYICTYILCRITSWRILIFIAKIESPEFLRQSPENSNSPMHLENFLDEWRTWIVLSGGTENKNFTWEGERNIFGAKLLTYAYALLMIMRMHMPRRPAPGFLRSRKVFVFLIFT